MNPLMHLETTTLSVLFHLIRNSNLSSILCLAAMGSRQQASESHMRKMRNLERRRKSRTSRAIGSILSTHEESLLLRQSDYWIIRYHGHTAFLKSTRGLGILGVLLRNPGREFHVKELLAPSLDASTPTAAVTSHGQVTGKLNPGVPVFDAQAKAECKCRLNELRQDLNEAERLNDPQRKTEAQNEVQAIADYLASAIGLGGRNRKTSSDAERARCAVTKSIRKAIQKIGAAIPSLGYHLTARIKTGYFCSYVPHPERPVNWKF
jgi:non-specific serine/threonine protein kinase